MGLTHRLLHDRSSVAFGVARRQLIIEGVATDHEHPVLSRMAESLHGHHFGAVSILRGVQATELSEALRALAAEPACSGPLGLSRDGPLAAWPHVKLHPLTFDGLALVGDAPMAADGSGDKADTRGAELWVGLARAALAVEDVDDSTPVPTDPSVVARAIDEHPKAEAYDQVIIGYLLQIARELKTASGAESEALRKKSSTLVASLRSETLRRLVEMGGDAGQRGQFVLDAAHGMAVGAVLEIVKAAAEPNGQTISHGLMRMLSKLAAHAETGSQQVRTRADGELRGQVIHLLSDWQLDDPNPAAYGRVLEEFATSEFGPEPGVGSGRSAGATLDPLRVVQMSLESGVFGGVVEQALDRLLLSGQAKTVFGLFRSRPTGSAEAAEAILSTLAQPERLRGIVAREPVDVSGLHLLIPHISSAGLEVLLDRLGSSEVRSTRRRLLDFLANASLDISGVITVRLQDERWHVQRNMLVLLARRGHVPQGLSLSPWTTHDDERVRIEAIRVQLTVPGERELAILTALEDADPRIVGLGLRAVQHECPVAAAPLVARLALAPEADDAARFLAAMALGRVRQSEALVAVLRLSDGGHSLLGRQKLPPRSPVLVAAIRARAHSRFPGAVCRQRWTVRLGEVEPVFGQTGRVVLDITARTAHDGALNWTRAPSTPRAARSIFATFPSTCALPSGGR